MGWILQKYKSPNKEDTRKTEGKVRCYADHNVDYSIIEALRMKKYDVESAKDIRADNQPDNFHFRRAFQTKRVLITLDKDFLNNDKFPLHQTRGIIILNVDTSNIAHLARAVEIIYVILGESAKLLKENKVIVNSDRTITLIERVWEENVNLVHKTKYRFDDNGRDIWQWMDND